MTRTATPKLVANELSSIHVFSLWVSFLKRIIKGSP